MTLEELNLELQHAKGCAAKIQLLQEKENVASQLLLPHYSQLYQSLRFEEHRQIFLMLVALEAASLLFTPAKETKPLSELETLFSHFFEVEKYYQHIGGLVGYVELVRKLLTKSQKEKGLCRTPQSESIEQESIFVKHASTFGLAHLERMALLVATGGLGQRLGLANEQGDPLPVAYLPFMGRSLLEGIIRDLEGLEHLYKTTYGRNIVIPLILMTSKEQNNEAHIRALFEENHYFGRPLASVRFFSQLSVPVMTIQGHFAASGPAEFLFHPAGHGALWKSAEEAGIFRWLTEQRIEHLLVRQINNPLAAFNHNFLAFLGLAIKQKKEFGFLACERMKGAAEGALVDREEGESHCIANIEYHQLGQQEMEEGLANTNILYARLQSLETKLEERELFGPIVNMKSDVPFYSPTGHVEKVKGGRLESMMQNISQSFTAKKGQSLPTVIVKGQRAKVMSAIKRMYDPKVQDALETAEAAHYDFLKSHYELLQRCTTEPLPLFSSFTDYLAKGPSFLFTYHPIFGPLSEIIVKKLRCKRIAEGAELQIEMADFACKELELEGSLVINGIGGRAILDQVRVLNKGIVWEMQRDFWKGKYLREECCTINIGEGGELLAEGVTFYGDHKIEVKAGHRLIVRQDDEGNLLFEDIFLAELLNHKNKR